MTSEILTPNKNYNRIRNFLRLLFLNGCYSRNSFTKYKILSDKQYRNYTNILMEYLNQEHHNIQQYSRDSLQLGFEYYETTENYLVDSYLTKSSSSNYMSVYFLVLQILNISEKPMKRNEIIEELYKVYGFDEESRRDSVKEISEASIYNYLKEFVHLDILGENEDNEFYINDDIFGNLSKEELINLYDGVSFFSDILYPSTPGYYLRNTLLRYIKHIRDLDLEDNNVFLHRFAPLHSVLDDEIVVGILKAIKTKKKIKINYEKLVFYESKYIKEEYRIKLSPIKIIFDLSLGRWYLAYLDDENILSMIRIDRIQRINVLKDNFDYEVGEEYYHKQIKNVWTASIPYEDNEVKEIKLQVLGNSKYIIERLMRESPNGQVILGEDDNYYFTLRVKDDGELLPWLRTLSPYVKIVENANIKDKFVEDLMKMRDDYGAI